MNAKRDEQPVDPQQDEAAAETVLPVEAEDRLAAGQDPTADLPTEAVGAEAPHGDPAPASEPDPAPADPVPADPAPATTTTPLPSATPAPPQPTPPAGGLPGQSQAQPQPGTAPTAWPENYRPRPRTGPIVWGALILSFCAYVAIRAAGGWVDATGWIITTVIGLGVLLLAVGVAVLIRGSRDRR